MALTSVKRLGSRAQPLYYLEAYIRKVHTCKACGEPIKDKRKGCRKCQYQRRKERLAEGHYSYFKEASCRHCGGEINPLSGCKKCQKRRRKERAREHVYSYLEKKHCVDCAEKDPIVLQFDHVSDEKHANISKLMNDGTGIEKIQAEMEKCVVRCANCHTRKTARDYNWYCWRKYGNNRI